MMTTTESVSSTPDQEQICPLRLGYIFLRVSNLAVSEEFYTKAVHLEVSERKNGRLYFRGGIQHHWIILEQSNNPGLERVGIEVADRATLDKFQKRFDDRGIAYDVGDDLENERIARYIRFFDPAGNPLELYCDMLEMSSPPRPNLVNATEIQHIVLGGGQFDSNVDFYTNVIGMKVSDFLEQRTAFMRFLNGWHHGLGVGSGGQPGLSHICFQTPDLQSTMRAREAVRKFGLEMRTEFMKHGPSTSEGFYFFGPDKEVIEFSYGARNIDWNDPMHKPRLVPTHISNNMWTHGLEEIEHLS
jgi:catechol 2,3-dioxygenase-like lactoylglutathione lyase family enzyme